MDVSLNLKIIQIIPTIFPTPSISRDRILHFFDVST